MAKVIRSWTDRITTDAGRTIETAALTYWAKHPGRDALAAMHFSDSRSRYGATWSRVLTETDELTVTETFKRDGRFWTRTVTTHRYV